MKFSKLFLLNLFVFGYVILAQDIPSGSVSYDKTDKTLYRVGGRGGLGYSTDNGQSWVTINAGLIQARKAILKTDAGSLLICGYKDQTNSIFRSTNLGYTWINVLNIGDYGPGIFAFKENSKGQVFGISQSAIYKSTDDGITWISLSLPSDARSIFIDKNDKIFVGGDCQVFISTDDGSTWTTKTQGLTDPYTTFYFSTIASNSMNTVITTSDGSMLFVSKDDGETWEKVSSLGATRSVGVTGLGSLLVCSDNGTYRSTDSGQHWSTVPQVSNKIIQFESGDSNEVFFLEKYDEMMSDVYPGNLYYSDDDGLTASLTPRSILLNSPNGSESWQAASTQNITWTSTGVTNVKLDYSTDNGTTWFSVAADLSSMYPTYMWTVPNTPSTSCKMKVYDASDTSVFDESDAVFTIQRLEQFTEQTSISLLGLGLSSVAWGDYNNDGYLDILLTGRNDASHPYTIIYKNNGDGTFTEQTNAALTSASSGSAAWGDYDNDGYLDILLTGYTLSGPVSQIYMNNGDGTFTLLTSVSLPGVGNSSVAWGDYDNDGKLDILLTGNSFGARISKIYKNNGNGILTEQTSLSLKGVYNSSVAWGDYDNDGYLDILLTGLNDVSGQVSIIYKNNGDGTFTEQTSVFLAGVEQGSVAWGDYDNDGYLDILLTGINGTNQISKIYKNTGAGMFTEQTSASLTGVSNSSVAWGDYNNDGLLDILLTGYEMNNNPISKIYKNMGEGIFYEQTPASLIGVGNSSAVWGDYDNDGTLDILLTGYSTGSVYVSKIYKNINAVFNTASTAPTNLTSSVSGNDVSFNWNKSFDQETPQNGLSYNLLIGTTLESVDVLSPMANKTNGFRRIVKPGNNQTNSWTIKNLPGGTYLWSVQAIDAAFTGSPFASQEVFTVGEITNTLLLLSPNGGENLVTGTVDTIHWSANYLTQVKLDYTTDYGATWMNIVGSLPAEYPDGYAWVVPNTPSTICKVRVTDINDPTMVDESDNVFTINSGNGIDSIMYGGKIYHTVKIGTQTWLKENLDIGTMIQGSTSASDNGTVEKYCYDNNQANCETYGGLYQWNEAMQYVTTLGTQGICPVGWHIPTNPDFDTLATFVNNDGNALKAIGQGNGSGIGTNTSAFSALLAGFRNFSGGFNGLGGNADFWSSTEFGTLDAYNLYLSGYDSGINLYVVNKEDGFSIRCLKDDNITASINITSPNGGEYFTSGTVDTIRWSAPSTTQVKIDYTIDDGRTWMNIAGGIYSIYPVYTWTVPSTASTTCKVRVTDNSNPNDFDESDSVFTIQLFKSGEYVPDANTVLLDHFNDVTDATILAYTQTGQSCGSELPLATPSFYYNPGMNELYQALTLNPPIEEPQGSSTYLKYPGGQLLSQTNGTIEFWVHLSSYGKGLSFVNQGQYFGACAGWTFNLDMDSTGMLNSSAWAAFSLNSGENKVPLNRWTHLAVSWGSMGAKMYIDGVLVGSDANTGMPANGYSGSLLITLGTGAGVSATIDELRVSNIQRTEFNIIPQQTFSLASPNGGENFIAGTVDTIRWTNSYATTLNIDYSIDNGATWTNIYSAMPAGIGSAPWLIPNTPSMSCKVRIVDANNANMFDESDRVFTISTHSFTSLVAYYPFTNASLADSSGNGNHAENFGGQPVADRFGIPGNAFYFDGASYMSAPNSPSLQSPTNMITLAGWIKPDLGSIYAIAVKSITSAMGQYRLYITDNSVVFSSNLIYDAGMPFTFEPGKWYFVAVTWDGNNINYFVNGNFIGSVPSAGTLTPDTEPLVFGMDTPGMTEYTNGTLDDIRIFNRALPTAEIRALYHEGGWDINNLNNGLVVYYPLNGDANDLSGNGSHGTINGATLTTDRFGNPNSAFYFDGSSSITATSSLLPDYNRSISLWFNADQTNYRPLLFAYGGNNACGGSFMMNLNVITRGNSYNVLGHYSCDVTYPNTEDPFGKWIHWVVTQSDSGTTFFINGKKVYHDPSGLTTYAIPGKLVLGAGISLDGLSPFSDGNADKLKGSLDDIRLYSRALTEVEVTTLYHENGFDPASITLTTPAGGEVFQANSLVPIEWSASNIFNFSLEFTSDNGASWTLICDTLTSASTGFLWNAPYIESDMVRVRVSDKNNPALFDESNSNFTVINKITQSIPLWYSGWNMISFYVQPVSGVPRDVFPTPPVLQVKTELQSYDPSLPEFLNTLKSVDAAQGYLVKTDSAEHAFPVIGTHFYPADGINYRAGWNLMSYYYSYGESVWYAFEPIMTSVEEIKSLTSYFNPLGSTETNTLYSLEPGEAYWLRLKNNIDAYVLPSPQAIMPKKHQTIGQKLMADLPWKLKGYTQSTVAIFTVTSNGKPVSAGSVVAAFVNNECRAISEVKLNSEGTAFATLVINGDKEEEVSFKIFDAVKKEAFGSNLKMKTKPGTTIPGIQELPFTFVTGVEDAILPTTTTLMNAYPNPFNPETRIRYSLNKDQHVTLKIYDVLGKEVITLVDDTKNAGYYEVTFDASGLPSGIYFYRMQSGEYVSVKKLLLLK